MNFEQASVLPMRQVAADWLKEKMAEDDKVIAINADLGSACGTLGLAKAFPDRVFNVGIAEANMAGVAAGLAAYGYKPYIFTFAPFATRRIADQLAISISYAGLKVVIIGTDPGVSAQMNGGTHMGVEDTAIVRAIPGIMVFEPSDCGQYAVALEQIDAYDGPVFIRQLRKITPPVYKPVDGKEFNLLTADLLKEGSDVSLIASGVEIEQAMKAADILAAEGISAEVIGVHTVKPLDKETIIKSVRKTGCAVVCDNHNVIGGLCGAVAETLALNCPTPLEFIGFQDCFGAVGKMSDLMERFEMKDKHIAGAARKVLTRKN
ncbi:MAG: transketolase family protein [Lachnospiraceae bacterium]|nr:transketolase family protein [Lachnospiraceae bacterium]